MLNIVFGYGLTDENAIEAAVSLYNDMEGRKTYHESKVRQTSTDRFRCEIWFTVLQPIVQEPQEKFQFIGTDLDPNDPNWMEKWNDQQDSLKDESDKQAQEGV